MTGHNAAIAVVPELAGYSKMRDMSIDTREFLQNFDLLTSENTHRTKHQERSEPKDSTESVARTASGTSNPSAILGSWSILPAS